MKVDENMKYKKEDIQFNTTIILDKDNKCLRFSFGGNGDLYWTIFCKDNDEEKNFYITKDNMEIYELFEKLFIDIDTLNIFDDDNISLENEKDNYRQNNFSKYNELYDEVNNTITWYSDETSHEVANYLKIIKEEDAFKIEFHTQPYIGNYEEDFHSENYIPIRFRNSGSYYAPFNVIFMRMYNDMKQINYDNKNEFIRKKKMDK